LQIAVAPEALGDVGGSAIGVDVTRGAGFAPTTILGVTISGETLTTGTAEEFTVV
jgi:hypothetical protein